MAIKTALRVERDTIVARERKLPVPGEVLVSVGQHVEPDTPVARAEFIRGAPFVVNLRAEIGPTFKLELMDEVLLKKQGDKVSAGEIIARYQKNFWSDVVEVKSPCDGQIEYVSRTQGALIIREDYRSSKPSAVINVAKRLDVWPKFISMYMRVREGDAVKEGQVIAAATSLSGVDFVYAPISGVIEKVCPVTGTVTISRTETSRVTAHLRGRVTRVIPDYGAVIVTRGSLLHGVWGQGGEASGIMKVLASSRYDHVDEAGVPDNVVGMVLVAGSYISPQAVKKAIIGGASCIISGGIDQKTVEEAKFENERQTAVIVLEGFGEFPVGEYAWDVLVSGNGEVCSVDAATQLRAGVQRPQIVICREDAVDDGDYVAQEEPYVHARPSVGDRVRCVRAPYTGMWGTVEDVPNEPQSVECEAVLSVVKLKLDDGRMVLVPEANIEIPVIPKDSLE